MLAPTTIISSHFIFILGRVNMTVIGNTYRWFHGKFATRPTNFSWIIDSKLAGSGIPMSKSQLQWVVENGINMIVTVREVPLPSKWLEYLKTNSVNYLHLKVKDYGAPTLDELDSTEDYIHGQIKSGKSVMVHCAAGRGRTGTILASYLLRENPSLTSYQAIKKIRQLRPGSIQSKTQEQVVAMYEKYLEAKRAAT
ncbi:MAG: dual specificity protein phosphatase family protein [Nitrososphaeraceae archaeon]